MSQSRSPPDPALGRTAHQAQSLAVGDWRAQVTSDGPNPLPSGAGRVNDRDVLATRWRVEGATALRSGYAISGGWQRYAPATRGSSSGHVSALPPGEDGDLQAA